MRLFRKLILGIAGITAIGAAGATVAIANPGTSITTTILGHRATVADSVQVNADRIKFQTKDQADVLMQTVTFQPHGNSGWHTHPGFGIVIVESGHVTHHDANCQATIYGPHESFVESGTDPHMVSNDSDTATATVYATFIAPAGSPFRLEATPPTCA